MSWLCRRPKGMLEHMGTFQYGILGSEIDVDDRALAHLQVVITAKLRRSESFTFTVNPDTPGEEVTTCWMHASIPMVFRVPQGAAEPLNRAWLLEPREPPTALPAFN